MNEIQISVIIPCYNHGHFLPEAVSSVLSQHLENVEIIVVDDGSTDSNTIQVLESLSASNLQVLRQKNQGVAAARNHGIRQSKGKYFIPLDADNILLEPYFSKAYAFLESNTKHAVVFGNAKIFGEKTGEWPNHPLQPKEIVFENYIDNCALIRKSAWEAVGGYDSKSPVATREDYIFWLDLLYFNWKFEHLNAFCFSYRYMNDSKVRSYYRDLQKRLKITEYIYFRQERLVQKWQADQTLTLAEGNSILSKLRSQQAYNHLGFGSIAKGYSYLWKSFVDGNQAFKLLKIGLIWPFKRLLGKY